MTSPVNGWRRTTMILTAITLAVGLLGVMVRAVWAVAEHTAQTRQMAQTVARMDSALARIERDSLFRRR